MAQVLCHLPKIRNEKLIVGLHTSDDAAVYQLNDETAIIQTLDFFTPVVDDPYMYGQIAAANSLSDVYAMGGEPIMAMNIVCFPTCLPMDLLTAILKGGADKVAEAGALLVGGHSVDDNEPKYGLSVTGLVHPLKVVSNAGAKPGDLLILTKPLGTGILNTALKAEMLDRDQVNDLMNTMAALNKEAAKAMQQIGANACTDITGFGFIGHAYEMAKASGVTLAIESGKIPVMKGAAEYAEMGLVPAGTYANKKYIRDKIKYSPSLSPVLEDLLFDPQTSGGLLISVNKEKAQDLLDLLEGSLDLPFAIVGEAVEKKQWDIIIG
ncbi:selenophosphate synthase [Geosporobacter subterraneus DSM 17957]|uniref:Selenide, water dikinase n=1 Tax=Geosporobacter subterraneus DSM 17957 TaxID=1121919 RepID=A0A1M6BQ22_9FIRM|nr:selenophosphate synthase [Geosporobacter subterraneus DSM 17957]